MIPEKYEHLLGSFCEMSRETLGENLLGVYLHGSAVMDCFQPQSSDLDLILVTRCESSDSEKRAFLDGIFALFGKAPPKGLELSVVRRSCCDPFVYPTPFDFHFSPYHFDSARSDSDGYVKCMKGTDCDLAAHFTVLRRYGRTLYGVPLSEVFGEVPREAYLDGVFRDIESAREVITENPIYVILNLCRAIAALRENAVLSKRAGGEWGLAHLPERFSFVVDAALNAYVEGTRFPPIDPVFLAEFADDMLRRF